MSADFAVVVGTFDERRWARLCEAVRSLRRRTLPPREIVVVVDHNRALLRRAADELKNVLVVENDEARGLRGVRNSGLKAATASYVAFLDDDAEASERWLELLAGPYEDPDVAGVGGPTLERAARKRGWDGGPLHAGRVVMNVASDDDPWV